MGVGERWEVGSVGGRCAPGRTGTCSVRRHGARESGKIQCSFSHIILYWGLFGRLPSPGLLEISGRRTRTFALCAPSLFPAPNMEPNSFCRNELMDTRGHGKHQDAPQTTDPSGQSKS